MDFTGIQLVRTVELWMDLIATVEDLGNGGKASELTEADLFKLVISDGDGTKDVEQIEMTLISCGDYHGNDLDSANNRALDGTPGVQVCYPNTGGMGSIESESSVVIGKMSDFADSPEEAIDRLRSLADTMGSLLEFGLLDEEIHCQYIEELADDAWSQWLRSDTMSELDSMLLAETDGGWDTETCPLVDSNDRRDRDDIVRDAYYSYEENEWNAESATSVVNGRHDEAVQHVFETVFLHSGTDPEVFVDPNQMHLL